MTQENPDPQKDGTGIPPVPAPVVVPPAVLDLGEGNLMNRDQAIEMRTAKVGLEKEKQDLLGQVQSLTDAGTKRDADLATANQARITAEATVQTADARVKEAEGKAANFVAPGDYQKLQEQVKTQEWNGLVSRTSQMVKDYNIPPEKLHGKDATALDAIEEGLKLGGGTTKNAPVLKGGTNEAANPPNQFNARVEANKEQLKRIRDGDRNAGQLG